MAPKMQKIETLLSRYQRSVIYIAICILPSVSAAQEDLTNEFERNRESYFSPRISIQQEFTNNTQLNSSNISGYLTQVSPGLLWISNTSRVKGFADYSLDAIFDSDGIKRNYINNRLNANAKLEIIEEIGFIDVLGSISKQPISAFGRFVNNSRVTDNSSEVINFQISPYIKGNLNNRMDYEARYSLKEIRSGAENISNLTTENIKLEFKSTAEGRSVRWSALASYANSDYKLRRNTTTGTLRGAVIYEMTPQTSFSLIAGAESTDEISPTRESHKILGLGAKWLPTERTQIAASVEKRYFGTAHNLAFEHTTGRTAWRFTDNKGISNGINNPSAEAGSVFDLLNGFYTQIETDPIRRTQLVLKEIERLGLTSDTLVFKDFLRSTSTLQRAQNLSLVLLGQRSTVTLSAFRLNNKRLAGSTSIGDDFEKNDQIIQHGLSLLVSHRLNTRTSIYTNLSTQRNIGAKQGLQNKFRTIKFGFNQNLSRRTNGSIQLNHYLSEQGTGKSAESSIMGIMTHRF